MDNFNLKKFLVENKLTYNSKMLNEMEFRAGFVDVIVPDSLTVPTDDRPPVKLTAKQVADGIREMVGPYGPYYMVELNPGVPYTVYYPNQDKSDYMIKFEFKQVGKKLEVDPSSVSAESTQDRIDRANGALDYLKDED
jgi:hypothetical protein